MEDKPRSINHAILGGVPFGALLGILIGMPSLQQILWVGLPSGLCFGLAIAVFVRSASIQDQTKFDPPADETLMLSGPANHFKTAEARGGRLYLTNKCLVFQPHKINLQTSQLNISLKDVSEAKTSWTFGIVPNGLVIKTKDQANERFVVNNPGKWRKAIMPLIAG